MNKYTERSIPLSWWQRMLNIIRPCFGMLKRAPGILVVIEHREQKLLSAPKDGGSDE